MKKSTFIKDEDLKAEEKWWEKKESDYNKFDKVKEANQKELDEIQKKMAELEKLEKEAKKKAEEARNEVEKTEYAKQKADEDL